MEFYITAPITAQTASLSAIQKQKHIFLRKQTKDLQKKMERKIISVFLTKKEIKLLNEIMIWKNKSIHIHIRILLTEIIQLLTDIINNKITYIRDENIQNIICYFTNIILYLTDIEYNGTNNNVYIQNREIDEFTLLLLL